MVVRFKSIGSAPIMKNNVFKITAGNKFQAVIVFLRGQLGLKAGEPLVGVVGAQLLTLLVGLAADASSRISTLRLRRRRTTRSGPFSA